MAGKNILKHILKRLCMVFVFNVKIVLFYNNDNNNNMIILCMYSFMYSLHLYANRLHSDWAVYNKYNNPSPSDNIFTFREKKSYLCLNKCKLINT